MKAPSRLNLCSSLKRLSHSVNVRLQLPIMSPSDERFQIEFPTLWLEAFWTTSSMFLRFAASPLTSLPKSMKFVSGEMG